MDFKHLNIKYSYENSWKRVIDIAIDVARRSSTTLVVLSRVLRHQEN